MDMTFWLVEYLQMTYTNFLVTTAFMNDGAWNLRQGTFGCKRAFIFF